MNKNPFSTTFGIEPYSYIDRNDSQDQIINDFSLENPFCLNYLITGIRGSGKTAMLSAIFNHFNNLDNWLVIDSGTKDGILENIASMIYEKGKLKHLFLEKEFSLSFHGIGFSIKGKEPVSSLISLLYKMFTYLDSKNINVLITVDEVDNSAEMKKFVEAYSSLIRQGFKIRLLMTGLYENVSLLQNNKALTFLYRSPKINLGPLPILSLANNYYKYLNVDMDKAIEFAKITKGYAYAYQLLGYLLFISKEKEINQDILNKFDNYLITNVYEKVYKSLSKKEKEVVSAFDKEESISVSCIKNKLSMSDKVFSVYRDRLIKTGIVESLEYGFLRLSLPRFSIFTKSMIF